MCLIHSRAAGNQNNRRHTMYFPLTWSNLELFSINLALASIVLSGGAIAIGFLARRSALPLRHGLLCTAIAVVPASPLLICIASDRGFGIVPISLTSPIDSESRMSIVPAHRTVIPLV